MASHAPKHLRPPQFVRLGDNDKTTAGLDDIRMYHDDAIGSDNFLSTT